MSDTPNANPNHNDGLAQPNPVVRLEASQQVIQKIPISKIMPNYYQPRRMFRPGNIQTITESILELGLLTPLKIRPLTTEELASPRPDIFYRDETIPRKLIGDSGFEFLVIGGHRRLEGARLAGLEAVDCIILNMTPEETHLASLMDNSNEEMIWWDWDLAIEREHLAFPNMSLRKLAKRLGKSKTKVGNALLLLKVLNEDSRHMIDLNLDKYGFPGDHEAPSPDGDTDMDEDATQPGGKSVHPVDTQAPEYEITENILEILSKLKDPDLIADTLEVVIDNEMTEGLVKKLVKWVQDGNEPTDFDPKAGCNDKPQEEDPLAEDWKDLDPGIKVKHKGGENYEIHLTVSGRDKALKTARAAQKAIQGGIF
jgi:hypothetical protein